MPESIKTWEWQKHCKGKQVEFFLVNSYSCLVKPKKRPSSCSKAQRSKKVEVRPQSKSASGLPKKHINDLLSKEEEYK